MTVWSSCAVVCRWPSLSGTWVRIGCGQAIGVVVGRLRLAVEVDLDAGGLARAVVSDEEVSPDAGFYLTFRHDLDRVIRPVVNKVGGDAAVLEPEVPAAVVLSIVHPREDRRRSSRLGQLDPGPERKCVISFKISGVGELGRLVGDDRRRAHRLKWPPA